MRVSQLFNTLLVTQQQEEGQEVRVSQLFNTLLFTQQEGEQEVRVSQLFNTLLFTQQEGEQEVRVSQLFNTLLFTQQQEEEEQKRFQLSKVTDISLYTTHNNSDIPISGTRCLIMGGITRTYFTLHFTANIEGVKFILRSYGC